MAEKKITLSKSDRLKVWFRHQYLQGSWNYERMQNGGWCFSMIPAIKKLYTNKDDQIAALKRHMEFYNTHPYVSSPVIGVTLALEEDRANGAPVEDAAIQGVKVGMMGPLAGVGDPVFCSPFAAAGRPWCLARHGRLHHGPDPVLRALERHPSGLRVVHAGVRLQAGHLHHPGPLRRPHGQDHRGCFHSCMFVIGGLVERWVSISFAPTVSTVTQSEGAYIDWNAIADTASQGGQGVADAIHSALTQFSSLGATGLEIEKVTTLQQNLDQLIPVLPLWLSRCCAAGS